MLGFCKKNLSEINEKNGMSKMSLALGSNYSHLFLMVKVTFKCRKKLKANEKFLHHAKIQPTYFAGQLHR